jgi:DNA adenine methylase
MAVEPIESLRAPFPYPGGKRRIAHAVWSALGNVRVYVEPFFGSGAVLLNRPHEPGIETINDVDGLLCNVWRALQAAPADVARHADFPVSEIDLHARHRELVIAAKSVRARLEADARWFDSELAGWWIWGASCWIGAGWCADRSTPKRQKPATMGHSDRGVHALTLSRRKPQTHGKGGKGVIGAVPRKHPNLTTAGTGVQRAANALTWKSRPVLDTARGIHVDAVTRRQMPDVYALGGKGTHGHRTSHLEAWFETLAARLRRVRVVCGDFERVLGKSTLFTEGANRAGVFLDPPYAHSMRDGDLYAHDDSTASDRARAWALEHGDDPRLRIVLAGLDGEHEMPTTWRRIAWKGPAGLGRRSGNRHRETLWLSPHCLHDEGPLFEVRPSAVPAAEGGA